ncbi:MAG: hypothetical protein CMJ58_15765 [Planctomycetaceae bacterium]|nr:hypothetical protein [Planctomycetaceae bacterium]
MDASEVLQLQDEIVAAVANAIEDAWDAAVVNLEIGATDGEVAIDCLALYFTWNRGEWKRKSLDFPYECCGLFTKLRDSGAGPKWSVCMLEIDSSGKYKFDYAYDAPRRLNGVFDDEALLKGYRPQAVPHKSRLRAFLDRFRTCYA